MSASLTRSVRRLTTFVWCLAMVTVLGLGWRAQAEAAMAGVGLAPGTSELRESSEPAPVLGPPPAAGEVGEDTESETFGGDDTVERPDTSWDPLAGPEQAIAASAERFSERSSQALERRQHNRGPPV